MKNLYKKGKVHPSAPPCVSYHLSLLPAAILTLTVALSPEDKEVLAYLISCCGTTTHHHRRSTSTQKSSNDRGGDDVGGGGGCGGDHGPVFECNCFRCYMSFWVRWDTSPNRQLIHEIIEAYEEGLFQKKRKGAKKKKKAAGNNNKRVSDYDIDDQLKDKRSSFDDQEEMVKEDDDRQSESSSSHDENVHEQQQQQQLAENNMEKGSVRKIVGFIGEKIWGVWNRN